MAYKDVLPGCKTVKSEIERGWDPEWKKAYPKIYGGNGHLLYLSQAQFVKTNQAHKVFPYLLGNIGITAPNQVWAIDINYIKMGKSHIYLTAIIDWYSRYIVGWELSDTLNTAPVLAAVRSAIATYGKPDIINSDQGCQFTSEDYTVFLKTETIRQSMDGKARWVDNVIIGQWFRSLKCDNIYINEYQTPRALRIGIQQYIAEYNTERPHQSFGYRTTYAVYYDKVTA